MRVLLLFIICVLIGCATPDLALAPPMASANPLQPTLAADSPAASLPLLKIFFLDIGQGDGTYLMTPNGDGWLIDGGPPGSGTTIRNWLHTTGYPLPAYTLATHYDLDHIAGLVELMLGPDHTAFTSDDFRPRGACFDRGPPEIPSTTFSFAQYLHMRTACTTPTAGKPLQLDPLTIDVIAINGHFADGSSATIAATDENAHCIVVRVRYGHFTYLHMADLPGGGGIPPYQTVDLETAVAHLAGPVDVLHVSHHGSKTATNATLLALTQPRVAIISVGRNNDYGHPHHETMERLRAAHVRIFTTLEGDVALTTDGTGFDLNGEHFDAR